MAVFIAIYCPNYQNSSCNIICNQIYSCAKANILYYPIINSFNLLCNNSLLCYNSNSIDYDLLLINNNTANIICSDQ